MKCFSFPFHFFRVTNFVFQCQRFNVWIGLQIYNDRYLCVLTHSHIDWLNLSIFFSLSLWECSSSLSHLHSFSFSMCAHSFLIFQYFTSLFSHSLTQLFLFSFPPSFILLYCLFFQSSSSVCFSYSCMYNVCSLLLILIPSLCVTQRQFLSLPECVCFTFSFFLSVCFSTFGLMVLNRSQKRCLRHRFPHVNGPTDTDTCKKTLYKYLQGNRNKKERKKKTKVKT